MLSWGSSSFFVVLGGIAVLALLSGVYTWLSHRRLAREATADWEYQLQESMQDLRLTKQAYVRAYTKVNAPRISLYMTGALSAVLVLTPIIFMVINGALLALWETTKGDDYSIYIKGQNNIDSLTFEPGNLVWGFSVFFSIIGAWILIGGWFTRRYHRRAPGLMRDELMMERAEFVPEQRVIISPNPAHIKVDIDGAPSRQTYRKLFEHALGFARRSEKNWQGSGQLCDIYSGGPDMEICVHQTAPGQKFDKSTHPFFFPGDFARADDKSHQYTLICKLKSPHDVLQNIKAAGLPMDKITGGKTSRLCSFRHNNLDIYLYDEQG